MGHVRATTSPRILISLIAESTTCDRPEFVERHPHPVLVAMGWRETAWGGGSGYDSTVRNADATPLAERVPEADTPVWEVRKHSDSDPRVISIGRAPGNDVVVPEPSISKHHCDVVVGRDGWILRDLGSRNGTRVDGTPLEPHVAVPLRSGHHLELGTNVHFRFLDPDGLWALVTTPR